MCKMKGLELPIVINFRLPLQITFPQSNDQRKKFIKWIPAEYAVKASSEQKVVR